MRGGGADVCELAPAANVAQSHWLNVAQSHCLNVTQLYRLCVIITHTHKCTTTRNSKK